MDNAVGMSDRKVHYIQYGAGWSCFTAEKPFLGLNKFHWEEGEEEEGGGGGEEEEDNNNNNNNNNNNKYTI